MPTEPPRRRARDLGLLRRPGESGPLNAITDVPAVRVGHATRHEDTRLHTGLTALVPWADGAPMTPRPAGLAVGNGYGKLIGATQLVELGQVETPVLLTSTLSVFRVADALVEWVLEQPGHEETRSLNPVVGETNDGLLSDIRARPVGPERVRAALSVATSGPFPTGAVGAGAGTVALGFKGGIGSASRALPADRALPAGTLGVLVQSNYGGTLQVSGVEVPPGAVLTAAELAAQRHRSEPDGNSCMILVATDLPLDARQLRRVAQRAVFAMGRTGANYANGSGDYAITLSTSDDATARGTVPDADLNPVFASAMEATEEALLDSLLAATTVRGHRGTRFALPHDRLLAHLGKG